MCEVEIYIGAGETISDAVDKLFRHAKETRNDATWIKFNDVIIKRSKHDTTKSAIDYYYKALSNRSIDTRSAKIKALEEEKLSLNNALTRAANKIWTTKDGVDIKIKDMDDSHLKNVMSQLETRSIAGDFDDVSSFHETDRLGYLLEHTSYEYVIRELRYRKLMTDAEFIIKMHGYDL